MLWRLSAREDLPYLNGELYREQQENPANPWDPWYDTMDALVVAAPSEERARALAAKAAREEGADAWLSSELSTCELVASDEEAVIISSIQRA